MNINYNMMLVNNDDPTYCFIKTESRLFSLN